MMNSLMNHRRLLVSETSSILEALSRMDDVGYKLLLVESNDRIINVISIGDIQRAILKNISLDSKIGGVLRSDSILATPDMEEVKVRELMLRHRMEYCPLVDSNGNLLKIYYWSDLFSEDLQSKYREFNHPVVIMAGGLGTRLKPLTNVIPKPLVPIGERTILEEIIHRYSVHGCTDFYLTVNYKSEMIDFYLEENHSNNYRTQVIREEEPRGTAGSLKLLTNQIKDTFFVNNCDIIIDNDYSDILNYHNDSENLITVVSALKNFDIPYGTIETSLNGEFVSLSEKPSYSFQVNSGMYILEPEILELIPNEGVYHLTDLITDTQNQGGRIGVFPVSSKSWTDIGNWTSYLNTINQY